MSVSARNLLPCLALAASLLSTGCSSDDAAAVSRAEVVANYAANLYEGYSDSVVDAEAFKVDVSAFLVDPTDATLETARDSWLKSREHYMLTEGARFYDGPIDGDPHGKLRGLAQLLAARRGVHRLRVERRRGQRRRRHRQHAQRDAGDHV